DLKALLELLDPDFVARADRVPAGAPREVRGAENWARSAIVFSRMMRAASAQTAMVDGAVGVVIAPRGPLFTVLKFTFKGGKIASLEVVMEPAGLRALDLALLPES